MFTGSTTPSSGTCEEATVDDAVLDAAGELALFPPQAVISIAAARTAATASFFLLNFIVMPLLYIRWVFSIILSFIKKGTL